MRKRTRPFFTNPDRTVAHWPRFDGVYRTRLLAKMWIVLDDAEHAQYKILFMDATKPTEPPQVVFTRAYGEWAFAFTCQTAQQLCAMAERDEEVWVNGPKDDAGRDGAHGHEARTESRNTEVSSRDGTEGVGADRSLA